MGQEPSTDLHKWMVTLNFINMILHYLLLCKSVKKPIGCTSLYTFVQGRAKTNRSLHTSVRVSPTKSWALLGHFPWNKQSSKTKKRTLPATHQVPKSLTIHIVVSHQRNSSTLWSDTVLVGPFHISFELSGKRNPTLLWACQSCFWNIPTSYISSWS